ncbi:MAG: hypothetical protein JOS17DRAFT_682083 [Linnemannia elongata]|nr:MAG: hypothetical protein JOS17DRAFT_682083 [Linnemannia elongata]
MHEREFQNMFVFTPGFEAATLKIPNKEPQEDDALTLDVNGVNPRKQIIGFAKFRSHQEALQAIQVLSGRRVDAEKGSLLKAEMAKKNLHTRRGLSNELTVAPGPNPAAAMPPTPIGITSNLNGINNSNTSPGLASPAFRAPVNPGDQNPPCNTLYVGNLPMNTSEDELRTLFSRCVGYRRMCFRTKSNGPMCFVEFENVECATQALNDLYGNPLSNSVKGGIRLSFSKNPLGVRNSTVNQPSGLGNLHNMNGTPFLDRRDSISAMFDQHY